MGSTFSYLTNTSQLNNEDNSSQNTFSVSVDNYDLKNITPNIAFQPEQNVINFYGNQIPNK